MDPLHLHLFLNHVPAVGGIGALLFLAWGLFRQNNDVTSAAMVALVAVAVIAIPVFLTGEEAEARVKDLPEVSMEIAEHHEQAAVAALVGIEAAGAIALTGLLAWWKTRRYPMYPAAAALLIGIAAAVLLVRAAGLGGQIRHSEIRAAQPAASAQLK